MLRGVFHLHEQEAREVMTPIPAVVAVDASAKVTDALGLCWTSGTTACWWSRTETGSRAASSMRCAWRG